jgi:hypothetical protein
MADKKEDELYEKLVKHIAKKESGSHEDPYDAANPTSSARGKYQFLSARSKPGKKKAPVEVWEETAGLSGQDDWVMTFDDSSTDRERKRRNQEKLMRAAYDRDYKKDAGKLVEMSKGRLTPLEAMALIHFRGFSEEAKEYAQTGKEPPPKRDKKGNIIPNSSISGYLAGLREQKLENEETQVAQQPKKEKKSVREQLEPDGWSKLAARLEDQKPQDDNPAAMGDFYKDRKTLAQRVAGPTQPTPPPEQQQVASQPEPEVTPFEGKSEDQLDKEMKNAQDELANEAKELPKFDRSTFEGRLASLGTEFAEAKKSLENRELAERLAQAFTQLGAGLYGMKTGQDMSGLKFDKADWGKRFDQLLTETRQKREEIRGSERGAERDFERGVRATERAEDKEFRKSEAEKDRKLRKTLEKTKATAKASADTLKQIEKTKKELNTQQKNQLKDTLKTLQEVKKSIKAGEMKVDKDYISTLLRQAGDERSPEEIKKELSSWFSSDETDAERELDNRIKQLMLNKLQSFSVVKPNTGTVRIQNPDGSIVEGPKANAKKYIDENPGAKIIDG